MENKTQTIKIIAAKRGGEDQKDKNPLFISFLPKTQAPIANFFP